MKILFVATEASPFFKTGGLGDVIGSLPKALLKEGADVRVIMPKYSSIPSSYREKMVHKAAITVPVGWRRQFCGLEEYTELDVPFYFIDNDFYFAREGIYGFYDDAERFAFFCRAVLDALPYLEFQPDIIHCHDWPTGMVSTFLKAHYQNNEFYQDIKTVFTIHNLRYQGLFPKEILGELLDLGEEYFNMGGLEFYGQVNYLKGGLVFSDLVTTVSPTYAMEIQTPEFGENLDGLLSKKAGSLMGIANGIDDNYNPQTDPELFINYKVSTVKKQKNKEKLQEILGLPVNGKLPMVALISRLVEQKGLELIRDVINEILAMDLQLVVLGTGEGKYEEMFKEAAGRYPEKLSANLFFDDSLARKIYSASDIFLMPSLFEPCGIAQLIAMRYGCVPLVRETGGLKDTVHNFENLTGEGSGFTFVNYQAEDLLNTLNRAVILYRDKSLWLKISKNISKKDLSWRKPAKEYLALYHGLLGVLEENLNVYG